MAIVVVAAADGASSSSTSSKGIEAILCIASDGRSDDE